MKSKISNKFSQNKFNASSSTHDNASVQNGINKKKYDTNSNHLMTTDGLFRKNNQTQTQKTHDFFNNSETNYKKKQQNKINFDQTSFDSIEFQNIINPIKDDDQKIQQTINRKALQTHKIAIKSQINSQWKSNTMNINQNLKTENLKKQNQKLKQNQKNNKLTKQKKPIIGRNQNRQDQNKNNRIQRAESRQILINQDWNIQQKKQTLQIQQKQQQKQKIQKQKEKRKYYQNQQTKNNQQNKKIYDKIRNFNQNSKIEQKIQQKNEQQIISPLKNQNLSQIRSRTRIQDQNKYLQKVTGRKSNTQLIPLSVKKLTYAQQILSGKMSIIWIFCFKSQINNEVKKRIFQMYNGLTSDDKIVPFVNHAKKIKDYLNILNCYFKIVTDIQSAQEVLGYRIYSPVLQFYIYHQNQSDIEKALQLKTITRKTKGIVTKCDKLLDRAEQQIQQQIAIYKVNNGLVKRQRQRKFPNFLKLTDTDKTDATLYRINLYGAIKLPQSQRKQTYEYFMKLVKGKYGQKKEQEQNIKDYSNLNHKSQIKGQQRAKQVIKFYVRESFYYQIVNSMLRTMKTVQQFKPCVLPFNQTYHSVKLYYEKYLTQFKNTIPAMILYRGCKMNQRNFKQLNPGCFIQMFGFMSTSKSQERAQKFVDNDGYLFVIHVKQRKIKQKYKNFDHGFVDINRYGLAPSGFQQEQQVLFNALNVYQLLKIQNKQQYTYIHLQYGVIFDLLDKKKQQLSVDQYDTLVNYHYCTKILGKIQDQGDVFLFANQLAQAKAYYDKKIKIGQNLANNYYKLANIQKECGQIDEAQKNANHALKLYGDNIDKEDKQKFMKVFSIHTKNAQINLQKQDYLSADQDIQKALQMLGDDDLFQKAVKLRQKGQIKFKKGEVKQAQKDFQESQKILQTIKNQFTKKKLSAYGHYFISHFSLLCSQKTRQKLKQQLKQNLQKVGQMQAKIASMNENIQDQLIKINKSLKDVSLYVQNRDRYEYYVKKAQSYIYSIQARQTNDPEIKAKLLATQAMIADYQELAQSQRLMDQAIKLIESKNPYDIKVAQYSKILAKIQKSQLQKYQSPNKQILNSKPSSKIAYDAKQRSQIYGRCKQNFKKTLNVLLYQTNKDDASPQILDLRNQLGQLSYNQADYSQCQKMIQQIRKSNEKLIHTQMSKALILKAKISYSRGQLKNSFYILLQAQKILQQAMVTKHLVNKKQNENEQKLKKKYFIIYQQSDSYLSIKFIRVSIYHKQKNHDLALKNIQQIQTSIYKKVGEEDSHPMLAQLLQLKGCVQVFKGNVYGFDQYFQKAIKLRQKQFGLYHPINAKAHCSFAKFLVMVKDMKKAQQILSKAIQIISAFDQNNPNYWAVYYAEGFFNEDKKQYTQADTWYQKSLNFAKGHFNKSHIAIKQIMLRYANSLTKTNKINQSLKIYEQLQKQLQGDIKQSSKRYQIIDETDDQKITLTKLMYSQLAQTQIKKQNLMESSIHQGLNVNQSANMLINTQLYKSKLNMLRNTYHMRQQEKIQN